MNIGCTKKINCANYYIIYNYYIILAEPRQIIYSKCHIKLSYGKIYITQTCTSLIDALINVLCIYLTMV